MGKDNWAPFSGLGVEGAERGLIVLHKGFYIKGAVVLRENAGAPVGFNRSGFLQEERRFLGEFADGAPLALGGRAVFDADGFFEIGADGDADDAVTVSDPSAGIDVVALFDGFFAVADVDLHDVPEERAAPDAVH